MTDSAPSHVSELRRPLAVSLIYAATLGTALLEVFLGTATDTAIAALVLLVPGVVWATWRLGSVLWHYLSSKDLFSPALAFPLAYVAWFSVGSIDLFDDGHELAYAYFVLGLLSYLLGIRFFSMLHTSIPTQPASFRNDWELRRFWFLMLVFSILTAGSYLYMIAHMGIAVLDPEVAERRFEVTRYGAVKVVFLSSAWTLLVFLALRLRDVVRRRGPRRALIAGLTLVGLLLLSFGNRGFLLMPFLTALVGLNYVRRPLSLNQLAGILLVVFMAAGLFGYVRDTTTSAGYVNLGGQGTLVGLLYPFFYAYEYVRNTVTAFSDLTLMIPATVPYQKGWLTFGAFTQVLPGHHESSDLFFEKIFGGKFSGGFPTTLLGPFYGDFGIIGIVVGMFLFGCLVRYLYLWMRRRPTVFRAAIYAWVMQTAILGLFGSLFTYIITLFVPLMWLAMNFLMKSVDTNHAGTRTTG